jgi:hypothetical protein
MGLELMPDGVTFKKLNKTQHAALNNYYKRLHDKPLSQDLALPIGLVVAGGIGAIAYVFKDEMIKEFEEQKEALWTWIVNGIKSIPTKSYGWIADQGFEVGTVISGIDLTKPTGEATEVFGEGVNICSQYEYDLINLYQKREDAGFFEKPLYGVGIRQKLKGMKKAGCSKPPFTSQKNWDRV